MVWTHLSRAFWILPIKEWTAVSMDLPFLNPFWASDKIFSSYKKDFILLYISLSKMPIHLSVTWQCRAFVRLLCLHHGTFNGWGHWPISIYLGVPSRDCVPLVILSHISAYSYCCFHCWGFRSSGIWRCRWASISHHFEDS